MQREQTPLSQRLEVQLQRVAAGARDGDGSADRDAAVVAGVVQDLDRQLRVSRNVGLRLRASSSRSRSTFLRSRRIWRGMALRKKVSQGVQSGASVRMVPWVRRSAR